MEEGHENGMGFCADKGCQTLAAVAPSDLETVNDSEIGEFKGSSNSRRSEYIWLRV